MKALVLFFIFLLAACGGSSTDEKGSEPFGVSVEDALKADCPNGGVVINQGIDDNKNGKIDKDEISSSETVCHGTDNKIIKSFYCSGDIPETKFSVVYDLSIFSSGDLFVTGTVNSPGFEVSSSTMFSAHQQGAETAPVHVTFDLYGTDNGGYWKLFLNRVTLVSIVEYHDIDTGTLNWSKPASGCIVNNY